MRRLLWAGPYHCSSTLEHAQLAFSAAVTPEFAAFMHMLLFTESLHALYFTADLQQQQQQQHTLQ